MQRVTSPMAPTRDPRHRRFRLAVIVASVVAAIGGSVWLITHRESEKVTTRGVTATLRVPGHPGWVAAGRNALWLALTGTRTPVSDRPLLRLDLASGTIERRILVGGQASYLAHVGNRLFASVEHVGGKLQREPSLADAPCAHEREQPRSRQRLRHLVEFALAPYERGCLLRQVVRGELQRAQRGEVVAQRAMLQLVQALRACKVSQPNQAEVSHRDQIGQPVAHEIDSRLGQQHLSAVGGAHDSRCTVYRTAEVVFVAALCQTDVDTAARAQLETFGVRFVGDRLLEVERRLDGVERVVEDGAHAVAGHLHDVAAVFFHGGTPDVIMRGQRPLHAHRFLFPQSRTTLDVREQERQDETGFIHRRSPRRSPNLPRQRHPDSTARGGTTGGAGAIRVPWAQYFLHPARWSISRVYVTGFDYRRDPDVRRPEACDRCLAK